MDNRSTFTNVFLGKNLEIRLEAWERIKSDRPSGLILIYILDTSQDDVIKIEVCRMLVDIATSKVDLAFIIINCIEEFVLDKALNNLFSKSPTNEELDFITSMCCNEHVIDRIKKYKYYQNLFSQN